MKTNTHIKLNDFRVNGFSQPQRYIIHTHTYIHTYTQQYI